MTIVEFLTARLDEMEAAANEYYTKRGNDLFSHQHALFTTKAAVLGHEIVKTPYFGSIEYEALNWVLADVAAKRAVIEDWRTYAERHRRDDCDEAAGSAWAAVSNVLVTLAGAYRKHPDYAGDSVDDWTWPDDDPAWRVE